MSNTPPVPESQAWEDAIPKIALGNAFSSSDLFYCTSGGYCPLKTEEHYTRAQRIVELDPRHFRILRYERTGWMPCLYSTSTSIDATAYILTGKEETFPAKQSGE